MPTATSTYDPGLATLRDRARLALGDTGVILDSAGQVVWLLLDSTLDALIAAKGYAEGVADAADGLRARFAQEPDLYQEQSGVQVQWRERIKAWADLATRLRSQPEPDAVVTGGRYLMAPTIGPDTSKLRF